MSTCTHRVVGCLLPVPRRYLDGTGRNDPLNPCLTTCLEYILAADNVVAQHTLPLTAGRIRSQMHDGVHALYCLAH